MMKNYIFIFVAAIMLLGVQNSVNAADYALTVTGGTGSGTYASGAIANIVAGPAAPGEVFDRWVITEGNPVIDNIYNSTTTLTMPVMDVKIQALYMAEGPTYFDNCDALTGGFCDWTVGGTKTTVSLNTTDMIQGTGCLENTLAGTNTTIFQSPRSTDLVGAAPPKSTGVTLANGILRLRFWIEDATKLGNNLSIEIGSGGLPDQGEIQFNITKANVKNGWNNLNLKLSAGGITKGTSGLDPNLEAINWFRIYSSSSVAGLKARLDGIMIYEPTLSKVDPPIIWAPADIVVNTALGATQLNATSPITGAYTYNPVSGTLMPELGQKELKVTFIPLNFHQFIYNTITDKVVNVNVIDATGVKSVNESGLNIYPNPLKSNGVLNIKIEEQDNYMLRISNMNGQTVYSRNLNGSQSLNVNGVLKQGAYIVSLISSKSTRNQKLVIE
jgi:hypothetical protein